MNPDKPATTADFPITTLTWAVVLTLGLFLVPAWQIWQSYSDFRAMRQQQVRLTEALGELVQSQELASLYARLAAATGDAQWMEQYQQAGNRWTAGLAEAARLAPGIFSGAEAAALEKAALNKARVEESALGLARQSRREEAIALLSGAAFQQTRRDFTEALAGLQNRLKQAWQKSDQWSRRQAYLSLGVLGLAVPSLLWIWLRWLRMARQHLEYRNRTESALREKEELTRTLLTSLPQRIFFKNPQLEFVGVNEMFARDLGRKPEEIVGKTDYDFFPADLAEKYRADDRRVMASREAVTLEERNVAQGVERIVEVVKAPVIDKEGRCLGLIGLFTDITARKQAERALRELAARLEQSNRELQEFAYVASHDLQEPLRKVRAFGDRLKVRFAAQLPEEGQDYINRMQNAAERMQALINALLAYSRVTTQAHPFQPVDLNAVIKEVLSDLEVRLESVKGTIEVGKLPTLEADPMQMRQLMQNLLGNALKFHRPDVPPKIKLYSRPFPSQNGKTSQGVVSSHFRMEPGREYVQIVVEDNGIGFDNKYAERIFGVFQRLHGRGEYDGSGVGLAICRKIALRHHGDIIAQGRPGEGATFILTLPLTQPKETSST